MTLRKTALVAGLCSIALAASGLGASAQAPTDTTLDATIVAEGDRNLGFGPGEARTTRTLDWKVAKGKGRALAAFKHVSDVHVIDEEAPARLEFFDECDPSLKDAYRVQDALTAQVGESMLRRLAAIENGPATNAALSFLIATGDNMDNNQFNELRWFIDLLDGGTVEPNSGGETYDGYTQEQFAGSLPDDALTMAQESFDSTGTVAPWYVVQGNHDALIRGEVAQNPSFSALNQGGDKPFVPIEDHTYCPENFGGNVVAAALAAFGAESEAVPADTDRRFLTQPEITEEYFNTTAAPGPVGHGLEGAPEDPVAGSRAGYFAFDLAPGILGVSLDTVNYQGGSNGTISDPQFQWLEDQLTAASTRYYSGGELQQNPEGTDRLIVVFSHHTSDTMNNPGSDPLGAPWHCFRPDDADGCGGEGFLSLLKRFPNVVAWVNGHEHNNAVRGFGVKKGQDASRAFWEVNTAAHVDWPQQARLIEIAWKPGKKNKADTVFVYGTILDHIAAPDADAATQEPVEYLASLSRLEAYFDACVREGQASCGARGKKKDRNVKLSQKAPFDLGE